jgi:hypothetical protein
LRSLRELADGFSYCAVFNQHRAGLHGIADGRRRLEFVDADDFRPFALQIKHAAGADKKVAAAGSAVKRNSCTPFSIYSPSGA